jgi:hypothetical protein
VNAGTYLFPTLSRPYDYGFGGLGGGLGGEAAVRRYLARSLTVCVGTADIKVGVSTGPLSLCRLGGCLVEKLPKAIKSILVSRDHKGFCTRMGVGRYADVYPPRRVRTQANLDQGHEAMRQGSNRLERCRNFLAFAQRTAAEKGCVNGRNGFQSLPPSLPLPAFRPTPSMTFANIPYAVTVDLFAGSWLTARPRGGVVQVGAGLVAGGDPRGGPRLAGRARVRYRHARALWPTTRGRHCRETGGGSDCGC